MKRSQATCTVLAALACACPIDDGTPTAGDPSAATTESSSGTGSSSGASSTNIPTTTAPGVCSDGVVSPDEVCDDGDGDPDDGCDGACQRTGVVEWTYTYNGAASFDDWAAGVAVDPAGRIIVVGMEADENDSLDWLILALDFSGELLWKRTIDSDTGLLDYFNDVIVADAGRIYAAGYQETLPGTRASIVRGFNPDGSDRWTFQEPPPAEGEATIVSALASDGDTLFSVGIEALPGDDQQLVVRRHDLATGTSVWRWTDGPMTMGQSVAVADQRVIVVGTGFTSQWSPVLQTYSLTGEKMTEVFDERPGGWIDVSSTDKTGEVLVAGVLRSPDDTSWDGEVRRVSWTGEILWSYHFDHAGFLDDAQGVTFGPGGDAFFTGRISSTPDYRDIFTARLGADGSPVWTATHGDPNAALDDAAFEIAAGPDFMIVVGIEGTTDQRFDAWVRRYRAE